MLPREVFATCRDPYGQTRGVLQLVSQERGSHPNLVPAAFESLPYRGEYFLHHHTTVRILLGERVRIYKMSDEGLRKILPPVSPGVSRSEEHTSELQSL